WNPLEKIQRIEEKMGTKRSVLTDEKGLPLAVVLSGANTHDVKLLEDTLDHIVVLRPEPDEEHPQNLCLDAGYTGIAEKIQPRGEEKKELERNPHFHARRWVVEVTHSFFNRFRKLLVRFEKKASNYLALVHFACAVIAWRKFVPGAYHGI
ncbi:MAG: transposase, partial [Oscillospiraceae bacterium]|nr:transposase [Oscillospiraceae bacterium]